MSRLATDYESLESSSVQKRRLLRQEELILEVTEALAEAMDRQGVNKAELARRLGKTRGFVTQILAGGRNLTLRTIADVADALGYQIRVQAVPHSQPREERLGVQSMFARMNLPPLVLPVFRLAEQPPRQLKKAARRPQSAKPRREPKPASN